MASQQMDSSPPAPEASTADDKKIKFRFCRECSNLLYPKEDRESNQLLFACRTCHYSEPSTTSCIYRNSLKEEIAETAGNIEDIVDDTTLPWKAVLCGKCGARSAVFFQSQQRTAETGMALFYVCTECHHCWSTLDAKDDSEQGKS